MKDIVIAIDGLSGCGKSTTAKELSKILNYTYLDSGAMYRAVTLYFIKNNINDSVPDEIHNALKNIDIEFKLNKESAANETFLNGANVELEIRNLETSQRVSKISAIGEVRKVLVDQQRKLGAKKGVVMDGRDIGTVVFPDAELKIFMRADLKERARRRQKELLEKGENITLGQISKNLEIRDRLDSNRKESPLIWAKGAIEVDTTHMTFEEQVEQILNLATAKIVEANKIIV